MNDENVIVGAITVAVLAVYLIVMIFFLITLRDALRAVSPENRRMEPGQVWLLLIPLFNIIWQFFVVSRVADSLADEFWKRGIHGHEARPGHGVGIAYCVLGLCGWIPFLGTFASLAALICWIVYWVKIANYKSQLQSMLNAESNVLDGHMY